MRRRFGSFVGSAGLMLAAAGAGASGLPEQDAASPPRAADPAVAPLIPVPEIDVGPHSGVTLGVILTKLHENANGEIDQIIAPDVIHSQYFGWGSRFRIYGYPSDDTQWSVVGGLKQRVEREFDARYAAGQLRETPYSWSMEAIYDRSGTARFFGLGNESSKADESTYVANQGRLEASLGRNFSRELQLAYVARLRIVQVLPGVLQGLPSTETAFPEVPGLGTTHEFAQSLVLTYDTRDSPVVPRDGTSVSVYGGFASRSLGSSFADSTLGVEARQYRSLDSDRTLAWHATLRYMPSARGASFWALSSLGGDRSVRGERESLRAFGDDRFVDSNLFAFGAELRSRVANFEAFSTRLSLELAPFVDVGKVFADGDGSFLSRLHPAAGVGIRGIASPNVVGYVDVGYGREKAAVFSGINYPF